MLFAGILWFLPNVDEGDGYTKAYDGFAGTESTQSSLTSGTESVMSPMPNQRNIAPTFHSNVSNISWAGNHSIIPPDHKVPSSKVVSERRRSSSEPVISNKPSDGVSSRDSGAVDEVNAMRRKKVVQVCGRGLHSVFHAILASSALKCFKA